MATASAKSPCSAPARPVWTTATPQVRKAGTPAVSPLPRGVAPSALGASSRLVARLPSQAPIVEIHHYPIGPFDAYLGTAFEQVATKEVDFLQVTLGSGTIQTTPEASEP